MNFDSPFSRSEQPSAVAPCKTACVAKRQSDDTLFAGVQLRIKALTGRSEPATAREPGDDGPVMMSADDSPCQRQVTNSARRCGDSTATARHCRLARRPMT